MIARSPRRRFAALVLSVCMGIVGLGLVPGCDGADSPGDPTTADAGSSSAADIVSFTINGSAATITGTDITLVLPAGTDLKALAPTIVTSPGATVSPASGSQVDFTSPVSFTVTAADNKTSKVYVATVTVPAYLRAFYVSNDGDDSASGTTPATAWKTIAHVNGLTTLAPGDAVLFERGGTWRETLVVPASGDDTNDITFGNYVGNHGTAKPKILGSVQVAGWTETSPNSHVWQSTNTFQDPSTQPAIADIFFDAAGAVTWGMYESAGTSALKAEYQWTWSGGSIYVYGASDPGKKYTAVEVPQNKYGFDLNNEQHLHFDGIDVSYTRWSGYGYNNSKFSQNERFGLTIENAEISYLGSYMAVNGITDISIGDVGYGTELAYTNMIVRNNKIHDCGRRGLSFHLYGNGFTAKNILIEGNEFFDGSHTTGPDFSVGTGYTASISDVIIRNNLIYENPGRAANIHSELMFFQNRVSSATLGNVSIYNNVFRFANGYGILAEGVLGSLKIFHNVFDGFNTIGTAQISVQNNGQDAHATIKDNVFYSASKKGTGVETYGGQNVALVDSAYNVFFNTKSTLGAETGSLTADPMFVDPATYDFHLQAGSPAINAGTDVGIASDRDGNPRVGAPDIGAYEFQ